MSSTGLEECNEFLIALYRSAHSMPLDRFQDAAMDLLRRVVPFDKSIWGTATMTPMGVDIHTVHCHRTSPEMLAAYEQVKHEDSSAKGSATRSASTMAFHAKTLFGDSDIGAFMRRFEHANYFVSMDTDLETNFLHWFSLYRAEEDAHCTEVERQRVGWLHPHLKQALAMNRAHQHDQLPRSMTDLRHGRAVSDLRGVLYDSDARFDELSRVEWGAALRGRLPSGLMASLLAGRSCVVGRTLVVHAHAEHGLLFLKLRERCVADGLTAREQTIARLIASGESYKEIARLLLRSPATVRNQIQTIYAKLEVNGIAELIEAIRPLG